MLRINLKPTRKKLMTVRESFAGNGVVTHRCSKAIVQFEGGHNALGVDTLDELVQVQRDGNRYDHANHSGRRWAFVPCRGFESNHQ